MGALLAAIVLGMSYTGLILSGVSTTWFQSFVGFLLLFAVIINQRTAGLERQVRRDPQVMTDGAPGASILALRDVTVNFGNVVALQGSPSRSSAARSSGWSATTGRASRRSSR